MAANFLRRARGVIGTMVTWAATWSVVGFVSGAALALLAPWPVPVRVSVLDLGGACAMAGALAGATSALAYAVALIAAGRRRRFDELRLRDVAGLGTLAATVVSFLISRDAVFVALCGSMGLVASAGSLAMARRAVSSGSRPLELDASID